MDHVAFLRAVYLDRILSGVKRYECRLSRRRTAAWHVESGHRIILKESGGPVRGVVTAGEVVRLDGLTPADIEALASLVLAPDDPDWVYWHAKSNATHAVLIELTNPQPVQLPSEFTPFGVMEGWVAGFEHGSHLLPYHPEQSSLFD